MISNRKELSSQIRDIVNNEMARRRGETVNAPISEPPTKEETIFRDVFACFDDCDNDEALTILRGVMTYCIHGMAPNVMIARDIALHLYLEMHELVGTLEYDEDDTYDGPRSTLPGMFEEDDDG